MNEDLLPSRLAPASFRFSKYRSTRWAENLALLYEQAIKIVHAKGEGSEAAALDDVASTLASFCLAAFDGSSASDILQNSIHWNYSRS
jgi:hypothetical protein